MANPPKSVSYLKQLVSASRAIITYQVGLPVGCVRIRKILYWLQPHKELSYPVFDKYLNSLNGLPISSERLMWSHDSLREADKKLEALNSKFRDSIFEACYEIIETYESKNDDEAA
jgi:hypothetical protein